MSREPGTEFDPVTLEILWNRLISIADQSATTLVRTSFSTVVRECNDYACVLMDRNGDTLAENRGSIPLVRRHHVAHGEALPSPLPRRKRGGRATW